MVHAPLCRVLQPGHEWPVPDVTAESFFGELKASVKAAEPQRSGCGPLVDRTKSSRHWRYFEVKRLGRPPLRAAASCARR